MDPTYADRDDVLLQQAPVRPQLSQYHLTTVEVKMIKSMLKRAEKVEGNSFNVLIIAMFTTAAVLCYLIPNKDLVAVPFIVCLVVFMYPINWVLESVLAEKRSAIPKQDNLRQFEQALRDYKKASAKYEKRKKARAERLEREAKRKQFSYWSSLDPYEFEKEVTLLFRRNGYDAKTTKASGDGGIDILLTKGRKRGIVQCKRYAKKVGPAPIRDLFGTMVHGGFDFAMIVCPAGFSDGAYEFSKGKNIELIGLKRIMKMANHES